MKNIKLYLLKHRIVGLFLSVLLSVFLISCYFHFKEEWLLNMDDNSNGLMILNLFNKTIAYILLNERIEQGIFFILFALFPSFYLWYLRNHDKLTQIKATQEGNQFNNFSSAMQLFVSDNKTSRAVGLQLLMGLKRQFQDLYGEQIDLATQGADLSELNLKSANLQGAKLQGANLQGAHLQEADLQEAKLQGANLEEAKLQGTNLINAKLQQTNLIRANLEEANLQGAKLQGANLQGAHLQEADLQEAKLQGANLEEAKLQGTNLINAKLQQTNLIRANLQKANLQGANLQRANLQNAFLYLTNLNESNLKHTNIEQACILVDKQSLLLDNKAQTTTQSFSRDQIEQSIREESVPISNNTIYVKIIKDPDSPERYTLELLPDNPKNI